MLFTPSGQVVTKDADYLYSIGMKEDRDSDDYVLEYAFSGITDPSLDGVKLDVSVKRTRGAIS